MSMTVIVKVMSEVSRILGWSQGGIEFEGSTLEDLFKSLVMVDGRSLYDLTTNGGKLSGSYVVSLNGQVVTSLQTSLSPGDRIMTMETVRLFQGG